MYTIRFRNGWLINHFPTVSLRSQGSPLSTSGFCPTARLPWRTSMSHSSTLFMVIAAILLTCRSRESTCISQQTRKVVITMYSGVYRQQKFPPLAPQDCRLYTRLILLTHGHSSMALLPRTATLHTYLALSESARSFCSVFSIRRTVVVDEALRWKPPNGRWLDLISLFVDTSNPQAV